MKFIDSDKLEYIKDLYYQLLDEASDDYEYYLNNKGQEFDFYLGSALAKQKIANYIGYAFDYEEKRLRH